MTHLRIAICLALLFSPTHAANDVLLQAISFMITGSDGSTVTALDPDQCVFEVDDVTYFLNNVELDRIHYVVLENKLGRVWMELELHGKRKVVQDSGGAATDRTLLLPTREKDRVLRAIDYIYSHGCKGTRSPF